MKHVIIGFGILFWSSFGSCKKGEEGPGLHVFTFADMRIFTPINSKMDEFHNAMCPSINVIVSGADPGERWDINCDDIPTIQTNTNNWASDFLTFRML